MNSSRHTDDKIGFTVNNTYYLTKILGSGASGTVYHAYSLYSGEQYAFKFISKSKRSFPGSTYIPGNFKRIYGHRIDMKSYNFYDNCIDSVTFKEFLIQKAVHDHTNVISVFDAFDFHDCVGIVLEYCEMGDLYAALSEQKWPLGNECGVKTAFDQLLDAVGYCHARSVYHCDLKPENILIGDSGTRLKLADFGLASTSPISRKFGRGSAFYMAPENILENERYLKLSAAANPGLATLKQSRNLISGIRTKPFCGDHQADKETTENVCEDHQEKHRKKCQVPQSNGYPRAASDVWALGVILLNMLFGRSPWKSASIKDPTYKSYTRNFRTLQDLLPVTDELCMILAHVFHPDPHRRITILQLRKNLMACDALIDYTRRFPWFDATAPTNNTAKTFIPMQRGISQLIPSISTQCDVVFDNSLKKPNPTSSDRDCSVTSPNTDVSQNSLLFSSNSLALSLSYTSDTIDKSVSKIRDSSDPQGVIHNCSNVVFQPYYEATYASEAL